MSIIEVQNLSFKYTTEDRAINDISFQIEEGEFVCVLGHNGSGKSTLAKLLTGLLQPKKGKIYLDGILLNEESVDSLRSKIGIVFQNPDNQFVGVTVKDDIAFGLENRKVERSEMERIVLEYAKLVRMDEFLDRNPEELSGGEKQRVAIAGVLAMNPEIIIFDESTSMLDPKGVKEVRSLIDNLVHKKTVIAITHNLNEAINADRVIVMNKGKIVLNDKPIEAFKHIDVLKDASLDILDSMKIIDMIKQNNQDDTKFIEVEEALWELSFHK